jgi:ADP-heptose:LPS heptosyltransferase
LLRPGWVEAEQELAHIRRDEDIPEPEPENLAAPSMEGLAPELLPGQAVPVAERMREGFFVRRMGANRAWTRGAYRRVLRGVEAIHGFAVSSAPIQVLSLRLDGEEIYRASVGAPVRLSGGQDKTVFNLWIDVTDRAPGSYQVELRASRAGAGDLVHRAQLDILPPLPLSGGGESDAVVGPIGAGAGNVDERVNALPSAIRRAARAFAPATPRAILVQRVDQLGDFVCTIPAIERLRTLFPEARLVGLVTLGNAALAGSLASLDEVIAIDFPEESDGRRVMAAEAQAALRDRLAGYRFDIALDLCESSGTRPLLRLSGAPFLYGFKDREFPWLSAGFELTTHDIGNDREAFPVAHKLVAMVDALGELAAAAPTIIRRKDLDRGMLAGLGIGPATDFAVIHTGARLPAACWPHYPELLQRLLDRTDLSLVVMGNTDLPGIPVDPRIIRAGGLMPFDRFDALVHHCRFFIGNDSGPKHLASLRGAPTISLHLARNNWSEWGQEASGLILSRRVPCAGCGIPTEGDECGKQWACLHHIRVDEVMNAVAQLTASS